MIAWVMPPGPSADLDGPSVPVRVEPIRLPEPARRPAPAEEPPREQPAETPPVEEPAPA